MPDRPGFASYAAVTETLFPGSKPTSADWLTGGVSADVARLDVELPSGEHKSVVVRSHGSSHSGHPAELEFDILAALHTTGLPVPKPLMVDASGSIRPDPFLVIEFVEGSTAIPERERNDYIGAMARALRAVHGAPLARLPSLPRRVDPLPEILGFLPDGPEWRPLRLHLEALPDTSYRDPVRLLHGDFWPENLLWRDGRLVAILDWEDCAVGDPLSDLAGARVELRYMFGRQSMHRFTDAYLAGQPVDLQRLALWQVYVAGAAQRYMGGWGLPAEREAHMRAEALAGIREAGAFLMGSAQDF